MILPIRTNILPRKTPYANYWLIAVNVVIFILSYSPHLVRVGGRNIEEPLRIWAQTFMLSPNRPYLWQFVTYAFLHGGLLHIIGNMYFLYLFGNNVNDKLGNISYVCFYLAGSIFSGIGHCLVSGNDVLGASGAVAAVTGAYFVLFPKSLITVIYWFFFIGTFELPALYFIGLKLIMIDNVIARSTPYVAYDAHLAGYGFGIAAILTLLGTGLIRRDHLDLWSMIRQWSRRRKFRDVASSGYDPFTGQMGRKEIKIKEIKITPAQRKKQDHIMSTRNEIAGLINQGNLPDAARLYLQLVEINPEQVLPRQYQLDIANQLMSAGQWQQSSRAYEKFLANYKSYEYAEQVYLMLGLLYSRYLDRPQDAIDCLKKAKERLTNTGQIEMCQSELDKLQGPKKPE